MKRVTRVLVGSALALVVGLAACRSAAPVAAPLPPSSVASAIANSDPVVILISIDGFRAEYFERLQPPALMRLAARGVRSKGLIPQFPSKTFPNHYTLVTGLRLPHHGIVSNNMVDPNLPGRFSMSNRDVMADPRWWGGEPVWNTVERQGKVAAAMFWPGSETAIGGHQATFWMPFNDAMPHADRVAQVLEWLRLPAGKRPSMVTLYFSDVDTAGHRHGPTSPELAAAVTKVDQSIASVMEGVLAAGLGDRVNFVVVSDHGMAQVTRERIIVLDDYVDPATVDILDWSPVLALSPKDGNVERLYKALHGRHPALDVYRKADIPAVYGPLAGHPRVPAVMGIAKEGWSVASREEARHWNETGTFMTNGVHGYDPRLASMHGLFIAAGPRILDAGVVAPFENIHVYDLLCALVNVQSARNDGDPGVTRGLLR